MFRLIIRVTLVNIKALVLLSPGDTMLRKKTHVSFEDFRIVRFDSSGLKWVTPSSMNLLI